MLAFVKVGQNYVSKMHPYRPPCGGVVTYFSRDSSPHPLINWAATRGLRNLVSFSLACARLGKSAPHQVDCNPVNVPSWQRKLRFSHTTHGREEETFLLPTTVGRCCIAPHVLTFRWIAFTNVGQIEDW